MNKKYKSELDSNLENLQNYINENNKLPSTRNKDSNIVNLAKWYYQQKIDYDKLSNEYKEKWNKFMEEYYHKINSNIIWKNNLNKVKEYILKFGKPPTLGNPVYKKLSKWLHNQKQRIYMKDEYTKKLWDDFNKEYLISNDNWYETLEKLKYYIDTNHELPLQTDENYDTRILSAWLSRQKKYYSIQNMKEEYKIKWKEFIEEYDEYLISKEEEWYSKLYILKLYINVHKEKPKQKVHHIGTWLYMQQQYYKLKKFNMRHEHIRNEWEKFNHDYRQYLVPTEIWIYKLKSLKEYINVHKKLPLKDTELYNWIKTQQKNYLNHRLKPDFEQHWKSFIIEYHEYFKTKQYIWLNKLKEVKDYYQENNNFPSPYHKIKDIRILGKWLTKQHENYRYNRFKNITIKETWEIFKTQYYNPEIYWKNTLNNLIHYIRTYKKIPENNDKKPEIRGLNVWMNAQYNHYHKEYGAMKNENLRSLWKQFLDDHNDQIIFIH